MDGVGWTVNAEIAIDPTMVEEASVLQAASEID
jgi:hypothetical protein